ncbi:accessory factor associated with RNA polymerase II [Malassezia sp. CBS 17886]|nr:accessory factor associated with RNA polymerase II [Malassezia sp. CBS 17886]
MSTNAHASGTLPDALLCLRGAFAASPDDPLKGVHFRDEHGAMVESVDGAASVRVATGGAAEAEAGAPGTHVGAIDFPVGTLTRLLRARDALASTAAIETLSPEWNPDLFLSVGALVFAVQQRGERTGTYLRNATMAKVSPLSALERPGVLEYLLGAREHWAGVVDGPSAAASVADAADGSALRMDAADAGQGRAAPPRRGYVPDAADAEFVRQLRAKHEVVLMDRNDALKGSLSLSLADATEGVIAGVAPAKGTVSDDVFGLRAMLAPRLESAKRRQQVPHRSSTSSRSAGAPNAAARRSRAQDPIILLSNSPTALVTMFNVKTLLQDGVFVAPEQARQQAGGIPELVVTIKTAADGSVDGASSNTRAASRRILVVDSAEAVNRLGNGPPGSDQDPWRRVIAVFTTGQAWQFKTYRWSDPRDLFKNVMGVYVRWTNEAPVPQVRDWNVTELQVDRAKRHTDKQLVAFFWRTLDSWVQRKKPHLQL